ncbi:fatty acid desaturase [Pseudofrankia sp. BMG5.37]|uniref:fatty acid desaturase family protein n=1 Tax=Pseudofrankia sp. BMG5.37 TaxID=3050035 RepID=UPI002893E060|nr:fatty acid desaturase [Pseudofrankia sp. BMG5.37]MDT3442393.1 fatty acid desaturase [Pseudofrankia sp. BMG5.37]
MTVNAMAASKIPDLAQSDDSSPVPAGRLDYVELSQRVKRAGLMNRRPGRYALMILANWALLGGGWLFFAWLGNSWWQLFTAAFLAVMFTQVAFLGHDAGHRQIFAGRRSNKAVGLLHGNLLVGLSFGWWMDKHGRHHAHPNTVGRDPDVGSGAFVFSPDEAHDRRGFLRWMTRHQAYLFFPVVLLEGLNLHVASVLELAARRNRAAVTEAALLAAHTIAYFGTIFLVLSPLKALVFIAAHQALFGLYMGCAFAPNHTGMQIFSKTGTDFLQRQVLSSRNIRGGRITDIFYGGLNRQIEHHLFPMLPRPNLRRTQAIVKEFCDTHGVSYRESSPLGSYREILVHLHAVGEPLRRRPAQA